MKSVRENTQQEIAEYIKLHSKEGMLTQSLADIGKKLGYSNATIHRGLHALEAKGLIEVTPSEKRAEPSTIFYKGRKTDIDRFLSEGVQLVKEVEELSVRLTAFLESAKSITEGLQTQVKIQDAIRNNAVSKEISSLSHPSEEKQQSQEG